MPLKTDLRFSLLLILTRLEDGSPQSNVVPDSLDETTIPEIVSKIDWALVLDPLENYIDEAAELITSCIYFEPTELAGAISTAVGAVYRSPIGSSSHASFQDDMVVLLLGTNAQGVTVLSALVNHISQFRRLRPHAASIEPLMDIWLSKAQKAKGPTLSHTSVPGMVKPVVGVSRTDADHSTHPPSILASQGLHTASAPIRMPSNPHVGAVELEGISAPGAPSASRSRDTTPPVHSSTPKAPRSIHSSSASEHGTIIPESSARSHGIDPIGDLHSTYKNSSSPIKLPAMPASRSSQIQDALPTVSAAAFVSGPSSSGPSSSTSRLPPPLSGTSFNRDKAKRPRPASSHWLPRVPPSVIASSHDEMGSELLEATPTEGESGGMPAEIGSVPAEIAPVATIAAMSSSVSLGKRPRHADTPGPDVDETRGTDVKISTWATGMAKSTADRNTKYRGNLESRRQPIIDLVLAVPACIPLLERADADPGALNLLQKLRDCTTHRMFSLPPPSDRHPDLSSASGLAMLFYELDRAVGKACGIPTADGDISSAHPSDP